MKFLFVVLVACLLGGEAGAELTAAPPRPVPPRPLLDLINSWNQSTNVDWADFTGKWKAVAQAASVNCSFMLKDEANPDGLRNGDGSLRFIEVQAIEGGFHSVSLLNFGSKGSNQGPFQLSETEPQFSQWGYRNGVHSKELFWEYSCRHDYRDDRLVCLLSVKLLDPSSWTHRSRLCALEDRSVAMAFQKEKEQP